MIQQKGELECVWYSLLYNLKGSLKLKGELKIFFESEVTCPSKGLLTDITSKHL
jgi:hypothetical protein